MNMQMMSASCHWYRKVEGMGGKKKGEGEKGN